MITLFSIPKAFNGHFDLIQRNAIRSWVLLPGNCEIILFGNESGTERIAREIGVTHIKDCALTSEGTPRVDDIFLKAQKFAKYDLLCYVNTDIIFTGDFAQAAINYLNYQKKFLLVGQRWDLEIKELLSFVTGWDKTLIESVHKNGKLHGYTGIDYFLFRKGLWNTIPPFAVGRTSWDNWLIYEACRLHATVIDATEAIHAVHQNHDYSHASGGDKYVWKGVEAQRNFELAGGYRHFFTILDASRILKADGKIRLPLSTLHLKRRLINWVLLHPSLLAIIDLFMKRNKSNKK